MLDARMPGDMTVEYIRKEPWAGSAVVLNRIRSAAGNSNGCRCYELQCGRTDSVCVFR